MLLKIVAFLSFTCLKWTLPHDEDKFAPTWHVRSVGRRVSVSNDGQHVKGLVVTMLGGLRRTLNSMVSAKSVIYTGSVR